MPLYVWEKISGIVALRKFSLLFLLALIWEVYALNLHNQLIFPTFTDTMRAFFDGIASGGLLLKAWNSVRVLLVGYAVGIVRETLRTVLDITSGLGTDFIETLRAMFNHLPAFQLLRMLLIGFGRGWGGRVSGVVCVVV